MLQVSTVNGKSQHFPLFRQDARIYCIDLQDTLNAGASDSEDATAFVDVQSQGII